MRRHAALLLLASLGACAKYHPQPLTPEASAAAFNRRTLADASLTVYLATYDSVPGSQWDLQRLALTAWYFRPDLEVSRRGWRTAQAGEITAGQRPPIGVAGAVERADNSGPFEAPWTVTIGVVLRFELGGKRGARIAAAQARSLAAELAVRELGWSMASDVRTAALTVVQGDSSVAAWSIRAGRSAELSGQAQRLYDQNALGKSVVDQANADAALAANQLAAARAGVVQSRAALAQLLGMPAAAVDTVHIDGAAVGCGWTTRETVEGLRAIALRRRYEMGAALASYAIAEAELRLEVAKQYPDLEFAPGYSWDQGLHRWIAALALPNLLLNRNRGPIGEATARRSQQASAVEAAQQAILSEVEVAWAGCRAAEEQLQAASHLVEALAVRVNTMRAAFERGEVGQYEGSGLALAVADAETSLQEARLHRAVTGSALERAAGLWTSPESPGLPDPTLLPTATFVVQEESR